MAVQLVPSAFLASAAGSSDLTNRILPDRLIGTTYPEVDQALSEWSLGHNLAPPLSPEDRRQLPSVALTIAGIVMQRLMSWERMALAVSRVPVATPAMLPSTA